MRKIRLWDVCQAKFLNTHLKFERVLCLPNPALPDGYVAVVFSTSDWRDIERLQNGCSMNLVMEGNTEQVITDVHLGGDPYWREGLNDYLLTVYGELWIGDEIYASTD